ncbi:unnamed protein product [Leptidea sinapis]|uniref:Sodium channel protein Nach n=1 Tax=Leptidea sinapis TaxID=189913 RepID=A0A5E4PVZ4_9NEOP|nr:unnamed protein product [Leptidea sinapis]
MALLSCRSHLKQYCQSCSFAGFQIIADDTKHWLERWIWVILVILAWYGSALLISSAWIAFVNNPISFGVETTYTDWDTKFPTVAICELSNDNKIYDVSDKIWTPDHLLDLEDTLKDIAYFRGFAYNLIDVCYSPKQPDRQCAVGNYSYYAALVRSPCPQLITNCSFNEQPFECCEYFLPLQTDMGTCYSVNSIQTNRTKIFPMISNIHHKRGVLRFEVLLTSMLYTLGEDEVPTVTTISSSSLKLVPGKTFQRHVTVRNIENDPLVSQTSREQRACRFGSENEGGLYPRGTGALQHIWYMVSSLACQPLDCAQAALG